MRRRIIYFLRLWLWRIGHPSNRWPVCLVVALVSFGVGVIFGLDFPVEQRWLAWPVAILLSGFMLALLLM